ncbi:MAG: universal stress protein [Pseudomonadota bacterium]
MYRNILVPVALDHDAESSALIDVANHLLEKGGKITLLHVVEEIPGYVEVVLPKETHLNRIKETKRQLADMANENTQGADTHIIVGHPSREILEYAGRLKADCIVAGSHKPGLQDYLIGSTAARIMRHAECAVHIHR